MSSHQKVMEAKLIRSSFDMCRYFPVVGMVMFWPYVCIPVMEFFADVW